MKKLKLIYAILIILLLNCTLHAAPIKIIRFGTEATYPPFEYIDESGQIKGFDIDIANALCEQIKAQCTFSNQSFSSLIPSLQLGKYDALIAAIGITEERKKQVAFTDSYYEPSASFIAPLAKKYKISDVVGKTIGVQEGTTFDKYLREQYANKVTVKPYASIQDALLDLVAGRVDLVLGDMPIILIWLKQNENSKHFGVVNAPIVDRQYFGVGAGIAVRKNEKELLTALNQALAKIKADGTYKKILKKYFGGDVHAY